MLETPPVGVRQLSTAELRMAVAGWLPKGGTRTEKIGAIESALGSGMGRSLRDAMAAWIVDGCAGKPVGAGSICEMASTGARRHDVCGGATVGCAPRTQTPGTI
jgi:hypothetical protein